MAQQHPDLAEAFFHAAMRFSALRDRIYSESKALKALKATTLDSDGGAYNEAYSVANLVDCDNSVYCTQKPTNVHILLQIAQPSLDLVLSHITVHAPSDGYTCPIRNGLVFGFHERPLLSSVEQFDNCTQAEYQQLAATLASSPEKRQRHHPIGYFELEPRMRKVTAKLDYSANFKYVIVTLLSARQRALLGEARNIDIQRIALLGQAEPVCHDRVEWQ
eukprot:TRINITY_DN12550_c0_g2_i1.p2 TRINITY_DN12550_c0_g2~~TRINITY_DN12550_c0_g2_i1.p2  ORF type:complete len:219 (+),score=45.05 TRINITY_DN12550_c0_g2_i1:116-772(+)